MNLIGRKPWFQRNQALGSSFYFYAVTATYLDTPNKSEQSVICCSSEEELGQLAGMN